MTLPMHIKYIDRRPKVQKGEVVSRGRSGLGFDSIMDVGAKDLPFNGSKT